MRKISIEERDILTIFRTKKLKTKLGTFIFDKEKLKQLEKLYKKSKYYKNGK